MKLKLSVQAQKAIMLALQQSLMDQSDIVPVFEGFDFQVGADEELFVLNPPILKIDTITPDLDLEDASL